MARNIHNQIKSNINNNDYINDGDDEDDKNDNNNDNTENIDKHE